jgi:hypothetical protein
MTQPMPRCEKETTLGGTDNGGLLGGLGDLGDVSDVLFFGCSDVPKPW